jgi:hypothetical protein
MNAPPTTSTFKLILLLAVAAMTANASVIPIGAGAFPGDSTLVTFTGLSDGTEVNGLSVGGILFSYSLGNGTVVIDGGPGVTNNIDPPNVVSAGNPSGVLTLALPGFVGMFGFGYAILSLGPVSNATTINLFSGTTNVGSLSYDGLPDPDFTGGFAGIQSTIPFNRVAISFNSTAAPAFALDNILVPAIPEPSAILLMLSSAAGLLWGRRNCCRKRPELGKNASHS